MAGAHSICAPISARCLLGKGTQLDYLSANDLNLVGIRPYTSHKKG